MTNSFSMLATGTAAFTRRNVIVSGRRGTSGTTIASIAIIPLMSVDLETRQQLGLEGPFEVLQTFVQGDPDIRKGDSLVSEGLVYPVRHVASWKMFSDIRLHIIVEKVNIQ